MSFDQQLVIDNSFQLIYYYTAEEKKHLHNAVKIAIIQIFKLIKGMSNVFGSSDCYLFTDRE
jgi:hypothetical protein